MFKIRKQERLKRKKTFEKLFKEGRSLSRYPLRLVWCYTDEIKGNIPIKFGVAVPKKKFPKAVQRNKIKRLLREAYRLNKGALQPVIEIPEKQIAILIIYTSKELVSFDKIELAFQKLFTKFSKKHTRSNSLPNQAEP